MLFNSKMCNSGKKWTGRASPPPTLARNQALYAMILEKMKSRNSLDDESSDEEVGDEINAEEEVEAVTAAESGFGPSNDDSFASGMSEDNGVEPDEVVGRKRSANEVPTVNPLTV